MLAPLSYILFDVKIFVSNVDEAIAYTLTYMIVNVMVQNYLFGVVRWPWVSELYEYCQGVFLSKAIVSVILNPRKPTFNVTAKGLTLDNDHLSELAWPFFAMYGLLLTGSLVAGYRYTFEPGTGNLMLIVGLWNTFNLIMAGVGLGAVSERKQPDRHPRLTINRAGTLDVKGERVRCTVVNVSAGGCALHLEGDLPASLLEGEKTTARLIVDPIGDMAGDASLPLVFLRSQFGEQRLYGCEFETMHPHEYYVLADLMYGESPTPCRSFLKAVASIRASGPAPDSSSGGGSSSPFGRSPISSSAPPLLSRPKKPRRRRKRPPCGCIVLRRRPATRRRNKQLSRSRPQQA